MVGILGKKTGNLQIQSMITLGEDEVNAKEVTVLGEHAFIVGGDTNGKSSLSVVDISNPRDIQCVASLTSFKNSDYYAITAHDKFAYVGSRDSGCFAVVDISNPLTPNLVSNEMILGGDIKKIAYRGGFCFTAINGEPASVISLDVTDPSNPHVVDKLILEEGENRAGTQFSIKDDFLFTLCYTDPGQIVVIDIRDPKKLKRVANLRLEIGERSPFASVIVKEHLFVVLDDWENLFSALVVINIENPLKPYWVVTYPLRDDCFFPARLYALDSRLLLTQLMTNEENPRGIVVLDVSDPSRPRQGRGIPTIFDRPQAIEIVDDGFLCIFRRALGKRTSFPTQVAMFGRQASLQRGLVAQIGV